MPRFNPCRVARRLIAAALLASAGATGALADSALGGMDPVSLRDTGRPVVGDAAISTRWKGVQWVFANEANRGTFEANPRAYAPGFDGNCPVMLAQGEMLRGRPELFVIVGKTLYLTSSPGARGRLAADPQGVLAQAAERWRTLGR